MNRLLLRFPSPFFYYTTCHPFPFIYHSQLGGGKAGHCIRRPSKLLRLMSLYLPPSPDGAKKIEQRKLSLSSNAHKRHCNREKRLTNVNATLLTTSLESGSVPPRLTQLCGMFLLLVLLYAKMEKNYTFLEVE